MSDERADCERVADAIFPFVEKMLAEHGEFFPVGAAMAPDGAIVALGGERDEENPSPGDIAEDYRAKFVDGVRNGEFRATVLLINVVTVLPHSGAQSDAIQAHMDAPGYSVVTTFPYRLAGGQLTYGEAFAHAGTGQIFPPPDVRLH